MRDLGQQFGTTKAQGINVTILKVVAIFLVVIFIVFLFRGRLISGGASSSVTLSDAPAGLVPVDVSDSGIVDSGVNLTTKTINLSDVKYGGEAQATATRSYGGGVYVLSVDATLPDPVNTNYQVWLVSGSGSVPIDYMRGVKTSWSLSLRDSDKFSSYGEIWITLERTKDEFAEEHVMEGAF